MSIKLPTRKIKDFDSFTKIECGHYVLPKAIKSCPKYNKSPNLAALLKGSTTESDLGSFM